MGCNGGNRILAWEFLQREGSVSELCLPFTSGEGISNGYCPRACLDRNQAFYKYYPNRERAVRRLLDFESIKREIFTNGPVTGGMQTYDDMYLYKNGFYEPGRYARASDRHSIIIVGYGNYLGRNYFIIQNSWGADWGEEGYFRLWTDRCDILSLVLAGDINK